MQPSDELLEKIWLAINRKQQSIDKQMDEGAKKYYRRLEANKRILEKSEKEFFDQLDEKKKHIDETENVFSKKLESSRFLYESTGNRDEQETVRRSRKRPVSYNLEMSDHPVYSAIIKLFSERGYKFDGETLKLYWELVTTLTRLSARQDD